MNTPRLRGLRSAFANPLAGGDASGPAEPVPRRLLEGIVRAAYAVLPLPVGAGIFVRKIWVKSGSGAYFESAGSYQLMSSA